MRFDRPVNEGLMSLRRALETKREAAKSGFFGRTGRGLSRLPAAVTWLACLPCVLSAVALGQGQPSPKLIEDVRVVGNRRIPESTILYYVQTKARDVFNPDQLIRDYRAILNTNFFEDAKVKYQEGETGVVVIFEVKERPLIIGRAHV